MLTRLTPTGTSDKMKINSPSNLLLLKTYARSAEKT